MARLTAPPRALARQGVAGFALIEALISLLIVSVGLLGIAKMHALAITDCP